MADVKGISKTKRLLGWLWSRRIIVGVLIIVGVIGRAQLVAKKANGEIITYTAERRDLVRMLEISGSVDAEESADLHFAASSRLSWVGVKEGDRVKKWQAIASVDTRTLHKQLKQDLNDFDKEFRDFDQTNEDTSPTSLELKRILEKAQYDLENEVLDVEIRDLAIKLSSIVTPIEGVVTRIDEPIAGVTVAATDIFQVVNPDTFFFLAEVDESDIAQVREGLEALTILDAYEEIELISEIYWVDLVSSLSDGGGTVFTVKLTLPVREGVTYRLGMNGDVSVILEKKEETLSLPIEALEEDGETFVYLSTQDGPEKRVVETGLETDDYVEIVSGVEEGEVVIAPISVESLSGDDLRKGARALRGR